MANDRLAAGEAGPLGRAHFPFARARPSEKRGRRGRGFIPRPSGRGHSEKGHPRHALFFAHLAIEKMLKAHVVRATGDTPPRIHDLLRLAELAGLSVGERRGFLAYLQRYCLEGRYPERRPAVPSRQEAESSLGETTEVLEWLASLLK